MLFWLTMLVAGWGPGAAQALLPRRARLSLAEASPSYYYTNINGVPGTYSFGYDTAGGRAGGGQYRTEERLPDGTVRGSYGYLDPAGRPVRYTYVADRRGYRVTRDREGERRPAPAHYSLEPEITWSRKNTHTPVKHRPPNITHTYLTYS